jgi:hypothetical protein
MNDHEERKDWTERFDETHREQQENRINEQIIGDEKNKEGERARLVPIPPPKEKKG